MYIVFFAKWKTPACRRHARFFFILPPPPTLPVGRDLVTEHSPLTSAQLYRTRTDSDSPPILYAADARSPFGGWKWGVWCEFCKLRYLATGKQNSLLLLRDRKAGFEWERWWRRWLDLLWKHVGSKGNRNVRAKELTFDSFTFSSQTFIFFNKVEIIFRG